MNARYTFRSQLFLPLVIIGVGVLFLLESLGYLDASGILHTWWPSLLILLGLTMFLGRGAGFFFPSVVLLCGAALQLGKLDLLPGNVWGYIWPALLVLLGLSMLFRRTSNDGCCGRSGPVDVSGDKIDLKTSFSESVRRVNSSSFAGGKVSCVFGECRVDLTQARFAAGNAVLHVDVKFGKLLLRVPQGCKVVCQADTVAGELKDLHSPPAEGTQTGTLVIEGDVGFGSLEVMN